MNDRLETLLSSPHRIRQFTIYALIVVLIAAVILPLISPLIGHHPLERLPNHGHIYPGGVPTDHLHSHERAHHQDNSDPGADSSGIVYLPPTADTTGGKSFNVILIPFALSLIIIFPSLLVYRNSILAALPNTFTPHVETPPPQPAL
ncbi:MAG: hypothetical protein VX724_00590 [Chloroflexota bacterium]|nr:hypothetical protein [Chloroflexota bacterium]